jgi:hypothetical protein
MVMCSLHFQVGKVDHYASLFVVLAIRHEPAMTHICSRNHLNCACRLAGNSLARAKIGWAERSLRDAAFSRSGPFILAGANSRLCRSPICAQNSGMVVSFLWVMSDYDGEMHTSFGAVASFALQPKYFPTSPNGVFLPVPHVELFSAVVACAATFLNAHRSHQPHENSR